MKLNEDTCHRLVAGHRYESLWTKIGETRIWESKNEKLLGLTIDINLNFGDYMITLCKKDGRKLSALSRIYNYMSFEKKRILLKAFVECPLPWMCHSRKANAKINHTHERALRIVYKGNNSSFEELLGKGKSFVYIAEIFNHWQSNYLRLKTIYLIEQCVIFLKLEISIIV